MRLRFGLQIDVAWLSLCHLFLFPFLSFNHRLSFILQRHADNLKCRAHPKPHLAIVIIVYYFFIYTIHMNSSSVLHHLVLNSNRLCLCMNRWYQPSVIFVSLLSSYMPFYEHISQPFSLFAVQSILLEQKLWILQAHFLIFFSHVCVQYRGVASFVCNIRIISS